MYTYWWHAVNFIDGSTCGIVYFISNVNFTGKIWESWLVNIHWGWNDQTHNPGRDNHHQGLPSTSLGHIFNRIKDGIVSVNTDTDEVIDACGAEGDICCCEDLAGGNSPYPASILYIEFKIKCLLMGFNWKKRESYNKSIMNSWSCILNWTECVCWEK